MKPMPWTPVLVAATVVLCSMWVLAQGPAGQPHVTHAATVQFVALPSAPDTMPYYALFYDVVNDFVARRGAYREEHLRLARAAHARGELVLGGALGDPVDGVLLVFRAADRATIEAFAKEDPYVVNGLVVRWQIRPWTVVIGNE